VNENAEEYQIYIFTFREDISQTIVNALSRYK